jgi:hypothetical protein
VGRTSYPGAPRIGGRPRHESWEPDWKQWGTLARLTRALSKAISQVSLYWAGLDGGWKAGGSDYEELLAGELRLEDAGREREGRLIPLAPNTDLAAKTSQSVSIRHSTTATHHATATHLATAAHHATTVHHTPTAHFVKFGAE